MPTDALKAEEARCAEGRTAPRVSLNDIENAIDAVYHTTADKAVGNSLAVPSLYLLSICIIVMRNGFSIIGKSAPASAANFDPDLGRKLAYEDAVRQIWPMLGFCLRQKLHESQG